MKEYVNCTSCGARFPAKKIRCPYCGTAYEPAAEEEYMGKLEQLRMELDEHKTDADKSTGKSLFRAVLVFAVVVIVVLLLGIGIFVLPEMMSRERQREKKEEFLQKYSVSTQVQEETKE